MTKKGLTATIYSIQTAVEHNADGSVTICEELVNDILGDPETSDFVRHVFKAGSRSGRFGVPVAIHKVE